MRATQGHSTSPAFRFKLPIRLRFLPTLIFLGSLFLTLKVGLTWRDADEPLSGKVLAIAGAEAKTAADASAHAEAKKDAPQAPDDNAHGGASALTAPATPASTSLGTKPKPQDAPAFTPGEVDVLRQLAKRREQLDARARELDTRDAMMRVAEKRIDDKVGALKDLQERVNAAIETHDAQQDAKLASLVKLYETMKPKDAAAIFEALDLETLLLVAERMKERKLAPIMAQMKPAKARDVTIQLVKLREIDPPRRKTGASSSGSAR